MWYYGRSAFGDTAGIEPRIRETSGATTDTYKTATCIANVLASSVYQLVEQMRKKSIPVGRLCRVLGVSRSGYIAGFYNSVRLYISNSSYSSSNPSSKLQFQAGETPPPTTLGTGWKNDWRAQIAEGPISNDQTEALARETFSLVVLGGYTIQNPAAPAT